MEFAVVVAAYLIGSVSFAVLVSRAFALPDPRSYGSKNPGATNVLRTGKKVAAVFTLLGDGGKGWLAVVLAFLFGPLNPWVIASAGLAVVVGHMYPVFHRFEGGKGVATAAGVLLAFSLWLGLATVTTWIVIAVFFRKSSLAALVSAVFAPFYAWWLFGFSPYLPVTLAIAALLVWRHKENLARLFKGEEGSIGQKVEPPTPQ